MRKWRPSKLRPAEGGKMWGPVGERPEAMLVVGDIDWGPCACGYTVCSRTGPCAPARVPPLEERLKKIIKERLKIGDDFMRESVTKDPDTDPARWEVGDVVRQDNGVSLLTERGDGRWACLWWSSGGKYNGAEMVLEDHASADRDRRRIRRAGEFKAGDVVRLANQWRDEDDEDWEILCIENGRLYGNGGYGGWESGDVVLVRPVEAREP